MSSPIATSSSTPTFLEAPKVPTTSELPEIAWEPPSFLLEVLRRSQARGAIGPGALEAQAKHSAGFLAAARHAHGCLGDAWTSPERFLDLGSGGGLPGLVIACLATSARGTLLDGRTERGRLLGEHVAALGWQDRIEVVAQRAEVAGRSEELRGRFDLVVARGFAAPLVTAECAAPFLVVGGVLVVSEPPKDDPNRWPAPTLALFGLARLGDALRVNVGGQLARFQVLQQVELCPERWPRRTGIPAKRPLSFHQNPA